MKRLSIILFALSFSLTVFAQPKAGVTLFDDDKAMDGYIFFSSTHEQESFLINNCGQLINTWPGTIGAGLSSNLMPNGKVIRVEKTFDSCCPQYSVGGKIDLMDWEGNLEWSYLMSNDQLVQHHDFTLMPNGNILVLGWELIDVDTQTEYGKDDITFPHLWGEFIYELEPVGTNDATVVWEWHLQDHFVQDKFSDKDNFGVVSEEIGKLDINYKGPTHWSDRDWFHCNAIDYNPERDEILINSRNIHEMWILDHSTTSEEAKGSTGGNKGQGGDFLFRWGNPEASKNGDAAQLKMFGSHGHEWIKPGLPNEGKIIFFNNGDARPEGYYSTAEMVDPSLDAGGNYERDTSSNYKIDEHRILYGAVPFSLESEYLSNVQQLENGNFFINEGSEGRFLEVTDEGEVVWEYFVPFIFGTPIGQNSNNRYRCFRAYKYAPDYPGLNDQDLTPGDYIETASIDVCGLLQDDKDGDGFLAIDDCDDNDPSITIVGAACDDGNSNTVSDFINESCVCVGDCLELDEIVISCDMGIDFIEYSWDPIPFGAEYELNILINSDITKVVITETEYRLEGVSSEDDITLVISARDISGCFTVTSLNCFLEGSNINIFPNPVEDLLTIDNVSITDAEIFDTTGRKIRTTREGNEIKTSHLTSGVYFLLLTGLDGNYLDIQKFVKL